MMGLVIGFCGFIFGVLVVILLAAIGYYADKNNPSNNKKIEKNLNNGSTVIDNAPAVSDVMSFDELPIVQEKTNDSFVDIKNASINEDSSDTINELNDSSSELSNLNNSISMNSSNDISNFSDSFSSSNIEIDSNNINENLDKNVDNRSFSSSNFENIEMSLDDLEKRNYDNIVGENNNNNNNTDDDNYYYSNFDSNISDIPVSSISSDSNDEQNMSNTVQNNDEVSSVQEVVDSSNESSDNNLISDFMLHDSSEFVSKNQELSENNPSIESVISDSESLNNDVQLVNDSNFIDGELSNNNQDNIDVASNFLFDGEVSNAESTPSSFEGISEIVGSSDNAEGVVSDSILQDSSGIGFENSDAIKNNPDVQQNSDDIPEISDNGFSIINDSSSDDDIWKF